MFYNHDTAVKAMMRLTTQIRDEYFSRNPAEMLSSAEVCLEDAEACYDRGDYENAIHRAEHGMRYLVGFYTIANDRSVTND